MNKENLIIAGVLLGTFLLSNYVMGMKIPKKAEPMSNASGGGCRCSRGVRGYCPPNVDCKTCCGNLEMKSSASGCGCGGSSSFGGCCGS